MEVYEQLLSLRKQAASMRKKIDGVSASSSFTKTGTWDGPEWPGLSVEKWKMVPSGWTLTSWSWDQERASKMTWALLLGRNEETDQIAWLIDTDPMWNKWKEKMNCHTSALWMDIQEAKVWKREIRNAMNMTQNKTSNESRDNNQKRFFSLEWEKSLHEMARMEWSQRDSVRPAASMGRNWIEAWRLLRWKRGAELSKTPWQKSEIRQTTRPDSLALPHFHSSCLNSSFVMLLLPSNIMYFFFSWKVCTVLCKLSIIFRAVILDLHNICSGGPMPSVALCIYAGWHWRGCGKHMPRQYSYARKSEKYIIKKIFKFWVRISTESEYQGPRRSLDKIYPRPWAEFAKPHLLCWRKSNVKRWW